MSEFHGQMPLGRDCLEPHTTQQYKKEYCQKTARLGNCRSLPRFCPEFTLSVEFS